MPSDSTNATRIAENADVFSFPFSKEIREAMNEVDEGFNTTRSYNAQELPWEGLSVGTPQYDMTQFPRHELDPRYEGE